MGRSTIIQPGINHVTVRPGLGTVRDTKAQTAREFPDRSADVIFTPLTESRGSILNARICMQHANTSEAARVGFNLEL